MVAEHRSVQLQHLFAACCLVQPVDILGNDRFQLSFLLQLRQRQMRPVRLCIREQHLIAVKPVKFLWLSHIKAVA